MRSDIDDRENSDKDVREKINKINREKKMHGRIQSPWAAIAAACGP